jgi:hypothetical protein
VTMAGATKGPWANVAVVNGKATAIPAIRCMIFMVSSLPSRGQI